MNSESKSAKRPPPKKQKTNKTSKEAYLIDQRMGFFRSQVSKVDNADEIFGKNVICSLKTINDDHTKEYAKLKIQEIFLWFIARQSLQNHSYPHRQQQMFLNYKQVMSLNTISDFNLQKPTKFSLCKNICELLPNWL